jgi:hypothetical protein
VPYDPLMRWQWEGGAVPLHGQTDSKDVNRGPTEMGPRPDGGRTGRRPTSWHRRKLRFVSEEADATRSEKENVVERVAIVARLKPGAAEQARKLVAGGPPFDLRASGIERHSVFVSAGEVVFVFEGHQVEWVVDDLIDAPFQYELQHAFDKWRAIIDGAPRIARQQFGWDGDGAAASRSEAWA